MHFKGFDHLCHRRRWLHRLGCDPSSLAAIPTPVWSISTSSPMPRTSTRCLAQTRICTTPSSKQCICDGAGLRRLFEKYQPDAVMNLAAESHVDRSIDGPGEFIQTNIVGTFTLLQEALRYWRTTVAREARAIPLPPHLHR